MTKFVVRVLIAILAATPSLAIAQHPTQGIQPDAKELTDIRIDVVKNALQLSPEQTQYWPAIETAIRARAEARRQRLQAASTRMETSRPDRDDFVTVLQNRAEALSERGAGLKQLADAWQPLYATLNDAQKRRMRILAAVVLRGAMEDLEDRRIQLEQEDHWGAMTGPGSGESGAGRF